MSGTYEKPITIRQAIKNIVGRKYLLPAIQRKFEWKTSQIELLFDSIMRHYPINTFMFWEVTSGDVKKNFKFYQFLEKYCERFAEDNPDFGTKDHGDFYAIIDGQQRLTSLYIGLKGSYAYRLPRKWWPKTQENAILPPRKLYLNIASKLNENDNDDRMTYEFKFLTLEEASEKSEEIYWFLVGDILDFPEVDGADEINDIVADYLVANNLPDNKYARKTINRLYFAIRRDELIHYYVEKNQNIDYVLDIFIRANHGGTSLSFSQLLMSIAVANWKNDAREQIDNAVNSIRLGSDMGFSVDRDWILKTALMLTDSDVKFKVENFSRDGVQNSFQNDLGEMIIAA